MSIALLPCFVAFALALVFALVLGAWRQRFEESIARDASVVLHDHPLVTLVVPARDAAGTITPLLQDLNAQIYPRDRLDVLVIDDGSSDGTAEVVKRLARTWPQLRCMANPGVGKKAAITAGVELAFGELIVLTDADARCGRERVARIVAHQQAKASDLVLLPVRTVGDARVIGRWQEAEQSALLGVTAATALGGAAVLANGANMAFLRGAFYRAGGYVGDRWASGDDVFLLYRMKRAGKRISYLLDREAMVTVDAEPSFAGFWRQRLRWAGKMRGVAGAAKWLNALGVLLPGLLLALTCAFRAADAASNGLFGGVLLLISAWALWLGAVLLLVRTVDRFLDRRSNAVRNGLALLAFTVYAPVIAVCAVFVRPKWKGRRI